MNDEHNTNKDMPAPPSQTDTALTSQAQPLNPPGQAAPGQQAAPAATQAPAVEQPAQAPAQPQEQPPAPQPPAAPGQQAAPAATQAPAVEQPAQAPAQPQEQPPAAQPPAAPAGPAPETVEPPAPPAEAQPAPETQEPSAAPQEPPPPAAQPREPPKPAFVKVLGVKFRRAGKDYLFNAGTLRYNIGDSVIVETDRGLGLARVVTPIFELGYEKAPADLKRVIRKANWNDLERDRKNKEREQEALDLCLSMINAKKLNMKMVRVEYLHDASKAIFYFTAEQRVDFRDLVKDMARQLHTRIEMRQIGVRDEAKITGGLGPCGREICCATFLSDFSPVSVRMAKDQNLAMNPTKVSGLCGRLMCCLAYEHPLYHESCKGMPKKGKRMVSPVGPCRIIDLNILGRKALVELESGKTMFVSVDDLKTQNEAMAEQADANAAMEENDGINEEVLESDDPALLEKMDQPRPGATQPGPDRGPRRDNRPSEPRRDQDRGRDRSGNRQNQQNRPGPDSRNGRGPERDRQGPPRPPAGAQPYKPPAGQDGPPRPQGAPGQPPGQNQPQGQDSDEQRRRKRRRRNRHRK